MKMKNSQNHLFEFINKNFDSNDHYFLLSKAKTMKGTLQSRPM